MTKRSKRFGHWDLELNWDLDIGYWDFRHEVTALAAAHDSWRLFTKNTAPGELARGCIGGDAWPVSER